jgi:O-antigen ligase
MPPLLSFKFKMPSTAQAVLLALVLLATSGDSTRVISIAGVSGLGALSLLAGGAVWAAWLLRPVLPPGLLIVLLPLIFFGTDAAGTLLWYHPARMDGIQLLVVSLTFLGATMLTARETYADPALARQLRLALLNLSILPVLGWFVTLFAKLLPPDEDNASRGFALYAMVIAAIGLATWRDYAWPEPRRGEQRTGKRWQWKSLLPVLYVVFTAYVVLMGMSRTALVAIAMLVPLALIYRGSFKGIFQGIVMMAIGGGIFAAILFSYQPLYDRFFKEDASMKVVGVSINATGRTKIWGVLFTSLGDDWVFGKGISASEDTVNEAFHNVGQPHNDYIRFYYDQGVLGLSLWLIFIATFVARTISNLRRSIRNRSPDYPQHLAALLALTAVEFSMLTDNSYCYAFVMFPLAILMGGSLGTGKYYEDLERAAQPALEPTYIQPPTARSIGWSRSGPVGR